MTINITVNGGLTDTPEVRVTGNGATLVSGMVISTERYKKDGEWVDGKKLALPWTAWREVAAGIEASLPALKKGTQVSVTGKLHTRQWEDNSGQKRSSTELEVTDFAVSIKRATVTVTKHDPSNRQPQQPYQQAPAPVQQSDQPWGAPDTTYAATETPF